MHRPTKAFPYKEKLPVSYLLFTQRGRITRSTYWIASFFIWSSFYVLDYGLGYISANASLILYPLLYWALLCTAVKRLHDINKRGYWLLLIALPVLGPLLLVYLLGFRKGSRGKNRFGLHPALAPDYFKNEEIKSDAKDQTLLVNDVTQLNPIAVRQVFCPEHIDELQQFIKSADWPVSVGGGRFSMGGQTGSEDTVHIDMRKLNHILDFSPEQKTITVQAGTRWCDIQRFADRHDLSVKIMQTYANFTVGGSLSVNCHGRYIGLGPLILSVNAVELLLANGDIIKASPVQHADYFFAAIGCYNAIGIIITVEFSLTENNAVARQHRVMPREAYQHYFFSQIRQNPDVVFHNADLYPPHFRKLNAVSWVKTTKKPNVRTRLMPLAASYPIDRYFIGAFSQNAFGKWRRQYIYDPILFARKKIHWRNYEAGYDVAELEPRSRVKSTYVLQEYFVPVKHFDAFSGMMAEIFQRHKVNVINISVRHALPDSGSLLAWAREEVFAFVIWYKQNTDDIEKKRVAVWTRELIDAALQFQGAYYLPYQIHARPDQFHRAYPRAGVLFALKKKLDPTYRFRNKLWDTYYQTFETNTHESNIGI